MKYALAPLVLMAGFLLAGQTTAPAPASQPATRPTTKNPDVEATIAKMPAELLPVNDEKADHITQRMKKLRTWSAANAEGKTYTIKATHTQGRESCFYVDGYDGLKVEVTIITPKELINNLPNGAEFTIKGTLGKGGFVSVMDPHEKGTKLIVMAMVNCELK